MNHEPASERNPPNEVEQLDERDRADMTRLAGHELMERHAGKLFYYFVRCLQIDESGAGKARSCPSA